MSRLVVILLAYLLILGGSLHAEEKRVEQVFEIEASLDSVWCAFTTTEGLRSWVAPVAEVDFRIGGKWRANYSDGGKLGDENTIENTILSYDPHRMLSLKATKFPKGFEYEQAAMKTWSIFYFTALSESQTKVTIVGLGYDDTEESMKLQAFFRPANEFSIAQLKKALEP